MKTIEELLGKEDKIFVSLTKDEIQQFLNYAKQQSCTWIDGKSIDVEGDLKGNGYAIICLSRDKKIGLVSAMCFAKENEIKKIGFEQIFDAVHHYETSESVNIGHPDKTCDTIADAFLDEALRQDKNSQMAVECAIKNNKLFIYGEATTRAKIDYEKIAKQVLKEIGYSCGFEIIKEISIQSPDINQAVNKAQLCANDQGICYGFATNETKEFMPLPIVIAHKLMKQYDSFRRKTNLFFADAKSQVTVEYEGNKPIRIDTVLMSVSHDVSVDLTTIKSTIMDKVVNPVLEEYSMLKVNTKYIINPSGKFTIWGSFGDSGCVGRKIVVDTYGGQAKVGGGCFSSKNATKVDRSGAYYARYVAKNIVAHNFADKCEIEVCYGIGLDKPIALNINTFSTEKMPIGKIYEYVNKNFDFSPQNMINELGLLRPIYQQTSCFGHFGRDGLSWEKIKD